MVWLLISMIKFSWISLGFLFMITLRMMSRVHNELLMIKLEGIIFSAPGFYIYQNITLYSCWWIMMNATHGFVLKKSLNASLILLRSKEFLVNTVHLFLILPFKPGIYVPALASTFCLKITFVCNACMHVDPHQEYKQPTI